MMHKLLDLQNFSVYWDVDTEMFGELPQSELAVCISGSIKIYFNIWQKGTLFMLYY